MPARERRQAILEAVQVLFAEKGFDGTTSREMARAAGVSEALLYKHFPDKDAIYAAIRDSAITDELVEDYGRIVGLPPSSATLVLLMQFFIEKIIERKPGMVNLSRLMVRSMLEDGKFAATFYTTVSAEWMEQFEKSFQAAAKKGDLSPSPINTGTLHLLIYSLCSGLRLHLDQPKIPKRAALSREELVEQCTWFTLMGIGLRPEVIRRRNGRHQRREVCQA